jgi:septal ring factor EnvC (AmiA/AmiB activator)
MASINKLLTDRKNIESEEYKYYTRGYVDSELDPLELAVNKLKSHVQRFSTAAEMNTMLDSMLAASQQAKIQKSIFDAMKTMVLSKTWLEIDPKVQCAQICQSEITLARIQEERDALIEEMRKEEDNLKNVTKRIADLKEKLATTRKTQETRREDVMAYNAYTAQKRRRLDNN